METALAHRMDGVVAAIETDWTPEALTEAVEREGKLRDIVVRYYKQQMRQGHHFYHLKGQEGRKPALSKEGGLNLCSLFKVIPQPESPVETYHADGHYDVRIRMHLVSARGGHVVATADGSCSTRESKYAYRWMYEDKIPLHLDKSQLVAEKRKSRSGGTFLLYRIPNDCVADQYNTVLKMADKRATVAAALKLPLASELFTQDLEETMEGAGEESDSQEEPPAGARPTKSPSPAQSQGKRARAPESEPGHRSRPQLSRLFALKTTHQVSDDALKRRLKAYGIESTKDLSLEQYQAVCEWIESPKDVDESFDPALPSEADWAAIEEEARQAGMDMREGWPRTKEKGFDAAVQQVQELRALKG